MTLGHNLSCANVVILRGLPWDYSSLYQFIARAHRLTSTRPVKVYIVTTQSSLDEKKWQLLEDKTAAAQLAVDGDLFAKDEEPVNLQEILEELIEQGLPEFEQTFNETHVKENFFSAEPKPEHRPQLIQVEPKEIIAEQEQVEKASITPEEKRPSWDDLFEQLRKTKHKRRRRKNVRTTTEPVTQLDLFSFTA